MLFHVYGDLPINAHESVASTLLLTSATQAPSIWQYFVVILRSYYGTLYFNILKLRLRYELQIRASMNFSMKKLRAVYPKWLGIISILIYRYNVLSNIRNLFV
jgi:hypothetical protein